MRSRVEEIVEFILAAIETGRFAIGGRLPGEDELAEQAGASRLTVREAVKTLAAQRVLNAVQGRGTFVNPVEKWISIEALMRVNRGSPMDVLLQLVEVRGYIEIGAAEHFARVVTDEQLAQLRAHLDEMIAAHAVTDVPRVIAADLAFHQLILDGCDNPFIAATMQPLGRALVEGRRETSAVPQMREHAIHEHGNVLAALERRDPPAARKAMRSHMRQTAADTRTYFRPAEEPTPTA
ncbi:MAG: FadR/GntR family transcriptional regulator [Micropruina sp.]|uniref:FadR/GntR family transcriptional regulator n=1 Tax=Micropruina sp. TaxID=2737536 RepID=UPI0039E4FCAF